MADRSELHDQFDIQKIEIEEMKRTESTIDLRLTVTGYDCLKCEYFKTAFRENITQEFLIKNISVNPFEIRIQQKSGNLFTRTMSVLSEEETSQVKKGRYIQASKRCNNERMLSEKAMYKYNRIVIRPPKQVPMAIAKTIAEELNAAIAGYTPVTNDYLIDLQCYVKDVRDVIQRLNDDLRTVNAGENVFFDQDIWF